MERSTALRHKRRRSVHCVDVDETSSSDGDDNYGLCFSPENDDQRRRFCELVAIALRGGNERFESGARLLNRKDIHEDSDAESHPSLRSGSEEELLDLCELEDSSSDKEQSERPSRVIPFEDDVHESGVTLLPRASLMIKEARLRPRRGTNPYRNTNSDLIYYVDDLRHNEKTTSKNGKRTPQKSKPERIPRRPRKPTLSVGSPMSEEEDSSALQAILSNNAEVMDELRNLVYGNFGERLRESSDDCSSIVTTDEDLKKYEAALEQRIKSLQNEKPPSQHLRIGNSQETLEVEKRSMIPCDRPVETDALHSSDHGDQTLEQRSGALRKDASAGIMTQDENGDAQEDSQELVGFEKFETESLEKQYKTLEPSDELDQIENLGGSSSDGSFGIKSEETKRAPDLEKSPERRKPDCKIECSLREERSGQQPANVNGVGSTLETIGSTVDRHSSTNPSVPEEAPGFPNEEVLNESRESDSSSTDEITCCGFRIPPKGRIILRENEDVYLKIDIFAESSVSKAISALRIPELEKPSLRDIQERFGAVIKKYGVPVIFDVDINEFASSLDSVLLHIMAVCHVHKLRFPYLFMGIVTGMEDEDDIISFIETVALTDIYSALLAVRDGSAVLKDIRNAVYPSSQPRASEVENYLVIAASLRVLNAATPRHQNVLKSLVLPLWPSWQDLNDVLRRLSPVIDASTKATRNHTMSSRYNYAMYNLLYCTFFAGVKLCESADRQATLTPLEIFDFQVNCEEPSRISAQEFYQCLSECFSQGRTDRYEVLREFRSRYNATDEELYKLLHMKKKRNFGALRNIYELSPAFVLGQLQKVQTKKMPSKRM